MKRLEELDKQEAWDNWYYTRLQEAVNKVIASIFKEDNSEQRLEN